MGEYPSVLADVLDDYVRRMFTTTRTASHLYTALRWVERERGNRFCETVFTSYRELATFARIDVKSVPSALVELQALGLIALQVGSPRLAERQGTAIARTAIESIRGVKHPQTETAAFLASALTGRAIMFNGAEVRPTFTVSLTGRVGSKRPNLQGLPEAERMAGLSNDIPAGFALFCADIKQAEPTVIKHVLRTPAKTDLYAAWMTVTGAKRPEAKKQINRIAYTKNAEGCARHWPQAAQDHPELKAYVKDLVAYRDKLAVAARKNKRVTTLSGRAITWGSGTRPHKGNFLNWQVQGTVADIVNAACVDLITSAAALLPVHDAVYAVLPLSLGKNHVADLLKQKASALGLRIEVKSAVTVPKTATDNGTPSLSVPETATAFLELTPPQSPMSVPETTTQYHYRREGETERGGGSGPQDTVKVLPSVPTSRKFPPVPVPVKPVTEYEEEAV